MSCEEEITFNVFLKTFISFATFFMSVGGQFKILILV